MRIEIKGRFLDILSFILHIKKRKRIFRKAPSKPVEPGKMNFLSERLHPEYQRFVIEAVKDETFDTRTYRLKGTDRSPAFFLPGQYISIRFKAGMSTVYRPFSISSIPDEALEEGYYDITVKSRETGGFIDSWIRDNWKEGSTVTSSGPAGTFTYQPLRDSNRLVCIAGGSGITPFKPLVSSILEKDPESRVLLFQGAAKKEELIFNKFWKKVSGIYDGRFFHIPVLSEPDNVWTGERGFISAGLIRERIGKELDNTAPENRSYFICGPVGLHTYMDRQLKEMNIPSRRIRREEYAVNRLNTEGTGGNGALLHNLTVRLGGDSIKLKAASNETVLVALERGGLNPPSLCRSGECGWCRSRLVSGDVIPAVRGGRWSGLRKADEKFGYFHPCSVFPGGDLEIEITRNPISTED